MQIADKYSPQEIESKWYDYWIEKRLFHSEPDQREPYTIVIPPPNVTGMLHMGHMLNNTLQDVLVRRARMSGRNACWVPGMDHASIATEAKVVAMLHEKGIEKSSLSREKFLEYAWEWKEKYGGMILKQLRKLGASCDWERTCFTMDGPRTESVIKVFCDLFEKGRIYRGVRMVNWDPAAKTALSDEEVVFKESHGKLYYLRYKIEGTDKAIIVATTRPETILGDTALCVNPNDPRYASLPADARVIVPLVNRSIPVIRDEYVDIEFGTGALKVTPAHDVNDYMLGEKYGLETIDIFNDNGTINDKVGLYVGQDRFDVRRQIEKDLAAAGLLTGEVHVTAVTGSTGAGVKPSATTHFSWRTDNISVYKAFTHQHLIEIGRNLRRLQPGFGKAVNFVPMRGDFARGILASVYTDCPLDETAARRLYEDYYAPALFTHVAAGSVDLKQVVNTDKALLSVAKYDGKLHVVSVIDNLLKGASGQAVQNMNLMFGLDEGEGLRLKASAF